MRDQLQRIVAALYSRPAPLLLSCTFFWGCNAIFAQLAKGEIGPFSLVLARWVLVAGIMWPLFGREVREKWAVLKPELPRLIPIAIAGFTAFNSLMYAAAYGASALNIGIIQGAGPVFALIGAYFVFGDRPNALQMAGVATTIFGIIVITSKGAPLDVLQITFAWGDGLMLMAIALYAAYALGVTRRPAISDEAFFTVMAIIAGIASLPLGIYEIASTGDIPTLYGAGLALAVAIFPSLLSQLFFLRGVQLIGPARAMVYINFVPVFASILAVVALREDFKLYHALALGLVTAGVVAAQRRTAPRASSGDAAQPQAE